MPVAQVEKSHRGGFFGVTGPKPELEMEKLAACNAYGCASGARPASVALCRLDQPARSPSRRAARDPQSAQQPGHRPSRGRPPQRCDGTFGQCAARAFADAGGSGRAVRPKGACCVPHRQPRKCHRNRQRKSQDQPEKPNASPSPPARHRRLIRHRRLLGDRFSSRFF